MSLCIYKSIGGSNLKLFFSVFRILKQYVPATAYSSNTNFGTVDLLFASEILDKRKTDNANKPLSKESYVSNFFGINNSNNSELSFKDISILDLENLLMELLSKEKNNTLRRIIISSTENRKLIGLQTLRKLMNAFAKAGRPDFIELLQKHCSTLKPETYLKNGQFSHYLAKAHCMKGNTEKGLSILKGCYTNYENFRSLYRIIMRELIFDTVSNKSGASMMIFKKHALDYSVNCSDHYPLICLWHTCWTSTWFSDQMLADELLELSENLQNIVQEKALAFSTSVLKHSYNEDAVVRLLQTLLKYNMMDEYVLVLQILFSYKLRNNDMRGCTEILRNCDALNITLPAAHQSQYLRKMIEGDHLTSTSLKSKTFKFKF